MRCFIISKRNANVLETMIFRAGSEGTHGAVAVFTQEAAADAYLQDAELDAAFDIHAAAGTRLGGVHLELTGEDVTECLGGARELTEVDLVRAYRSSVDPRLNYEESMELAMLIVRKGAG